MYYSHFGLKEPPFKITPNTEFFFNGSNRGAVLDALIYAISSGEGIVKVVGEVGSGKTMLCRMLQTMLPSHIECIYLANPSVAPEDILHAIAFELGLKLPKNVDKLKVMQSLQTYLLDRHESGKQVVIFVEEAQGMPLATLEEIRLLSNLETKHDKLLQMVLFGQPELDENLNQPHIRQLRERITHSFNLTPLLNNEVGDYLIFRLRAAGYYGPHLFTEKAIAMISVAAEGLVRRVNILAEKSLLAAYADNVYQVTPKHVKAAIADSEFGAEKAKKAKKSNWILGLIALSLLAIALGYFAQYYQLPKEISHLLHRFNIATARGEKASVQKPKIAAKKVELIKAKPAIKQTEEAAASQPVAEVQNTTVNPDIAPTVSSTEGLPETQPSAPQLHVPIQAVQPAQATPTTQQNTPSPGQAMPPAAQTPVAQASTAQVPIAQANITPPALPKTDASANVDILQARLEATKDWLRMSAEDTVTIQILGTFDEQQLKQQLMYLAQSIELDNMYVYQTNVKQQPFYTLVYGSFVDRFAANDALNKIPKSLQKNRPHLRTIGGILAETNKST